MWCNAQEETLQSDRTVGSGWTTHKIKCCILAHLDWRYGLSTSNFAIQYTIYYIHICVYIQSTYHHILDNIGLIMFDL